MLLFSVIIISINVTFCLGGMGGGGGGGIAKETSLCVLTIFREIFSSALL